MVLTAFWRHLWSITEQTHGNMKSTSVTHSATPRVPLFCPYDILTSSVIYYWKDARQHGICLLNIITKSLFYFKIFQHNAKAGLLPRLFPAFARKKAIWRDLRFKQKEAISLVAMRSKELWLVKKNRATVKLDSSVAPSCMKTYNLVPKAFSSTIFKMADRREKTLVNAELTPSLIGPFIRTRWLG